MVTLANQDTYTCLLHDFATGSITKEDVPLFFSCDETVRYCESITKMSSILKSEYKFNSRK